MLELWYVTTKFLNSCLANLIFLFFFQSRSKQQLQSGVSIAEALKLEEEFFRTHPDFQRNGIKVGIPGLAKELSQVSTTIFVFIYLNNSRKTDFAPPPNLIIRCSKRNYKGKTYSRLINKL